MNSFTKVGRGLRLGRSTRAMFAAMSMLAPSAYSANLTLVGSSDTNWNTNLDNKVWNNSGSLVAFKNGDNVRIDSASFTGSKLTMDARVTPGDVEIDISNPITLALTAFNQGLGVDTRSFTKTGAGTLFLEGVGGASGDTARGNSMTCGVDVVEGEIACVTRGFQNSLGPRTVPFWVHVHDGAALTFLNGNQTGTVNIPECGFMLQLDDGGKLNFGTNVLTETDNRTKNGVLCLNTLRLNGGNIAIGSCMYQKEDKSLGGECVAKIYNTLWFSGDTPHAFGFAEGDYPGCKAYTLDGTLQNRKISLNSYAPVEFRVDDIDNDEDGVDAYVNMKAFTWGTNTVNIYKSDIVKTGAGKLSFPVNTVTKTFLGDFTIKEGTVEFCKQGFFPSDGANLQTLSVLTNATLRMTIHNVVNGNVSNMPNVNIVVDHGVLDFTCTGGMLQAKDWVFDDATLHIHNKGMSAVVGVFYFKNSATFSGTKPLVMWPDETLATANQAVLVHNGSRTKIDVADMTGDGRTDVVMGYHIWNGTVGTGTEDVLTDSGFVKTGAGTFSVASTANKVSGVVTVSNGVMRVDGTLVTPSSVEVVAGAYIGGTGTVQNVAMETGSGFAAPAGQRTPLTVSGNLALPETGVVDILNLESADEGKLPAAKLVMCTGTLSGAENLANWTVKVDGETTRKWRLCADGNTVKATMISGMIITFR